MGVGVPVITAPARRYDSFAPQSRSFKPGFLFPESGRSALMLGVAVCPQWLETRHLNRPLGPCLTTRSSYKVV